MVKRNNILKNLILAILLGFVASLIGELLLAAIKTSTKSLATKQIWYIYPLIGSVFLVVIRRYMLGDNIDFGIDEIQDEIKNIKYKVMNIEDTLVKSSLTFVTLVFGFSAGKFGPLIHIGGSIGSNMAYNLKLNKEDIRYFIGAGVAATLSGFFGNPLFGVFFAIEILFHYKINWRVIYIFIGGFSALIVSRFIIKEDFFYIEHLGVDLSIGEIVIRLLIIGIITGLVSSVYDMILKKSKSFIKKNEKFYYPLIGGILMSLIGYFYPQIFDLYIDINHVTLNGELLVHTAIILILLKLLATGITFSFGGVGGGFGPAIYIGTLIGYSVSVLGLQANYCNILGMVGMMAGYSNAPIASAFLFAGIMENKIFFIPFIILSIISSYLNKRIVRRITKNWSE